MAKRETAKINNDESYYKNFVIPCVIFLVGYRFHYGRGNARGWTEGCFVLSSDYTISGGKVQYNLNESKKASQNFDKILGASSHYDYKIPARNGTTKTRNGSRFDTSISHKLILKSRTK